MPIRPDYNKLFVVASGCAMQLHVTVCAKQIAFVELAAYTPPCARSSVGQTKTFELRITMMKSKRAETSTVAAFQAATALILHHLSFVSSKPSRNRFRGLLLSYGCRHNW